VSLSSDGLLSRVQAIFRGSIQPHPIPVYGIVTQIMLDPLK
jgi:hypothetical protein